jgi:hypothetical protein
MRAPPEVRISEKDRAEAVRRYRRWDRAQQEARRKIGEAQNAADAATSEMWSWMGDLAVKYDVPFHPFDLDTETGIFRPAKRPTGAAPAPLPIPPAPPKGKRP